MSSEYEKISNYESLYQAHKKARLGKQTTREVIQYEMFLTENLEKLRFHLENHTYRIWGYRKFLIFDPKKREIQVLRYGDHEVLKRKLRCTKLADDVKQLLDMIVDSYEHEEGKGLPMGNQTSQWFALYYLHSLDRLVKEKSRRRLPWVSFLSDRDGQGDPHASPVWKETSET